MTNMLDTHERQPVQASRSRANGITDRELALRSRLVLDLAPHTIRLITLAAAIGVVMILVGSLAGNRPTTIGVDKLIHLGGYTILAATFVLALPPRWYFPALASLAGLSYLIEIVQPLNQRNFDPGDAVANTIGLAIGAAAGIGVRVAYGYLKTELATARVRRKLVTVPPGTTIVREGDTVDRFFVVKRGSVALYRSENGVQVLIATVAAGQTFGLLAEIQQMPQHATAVAESEVQVYPLDYDDIIEGVGGTEQPVGVVVRSLASDLRTARDTITALQAVLAASTEDNDARA